MYCKQLAQIVVGAVAVEAIVVEAVTAEVAVVAVAGVVPLSLKVMLKAKELSQAFIVSGKPVKFDFPQKATPVVYVELRFKEDTRKDNDNS